VTLLALTAFLVAWLLGSLIVAALGPQSRRLRAELGLILSLGAIVGLGATSVIFFGVSLFAPQPAWPAAAIEIVLMVALAVMLARRAVAIPAVNPPPIPATPPFSWLHWALATVLVQAVAIGAVVVWRAFRTEPFGGWDGWAIWNLQARAMVRGGTGWPELLATPELSWTHPDYPKLVSASVARLWSWSGGEPAAAAGLVSAAFAAAILGLLVFTLARLRGRTPALLTGLLLVSTPFFLSFAPNQHADLPLAACVLAAVALGALGERWALAGLCAGFAAWTKNEGLLFAAVFALGGGWHAWRGGPPRALPQLLASLALGLAPVLWLKLALAPPNDLLATPLGPRLAQLLAPDRHRLILEVLWRDLRGFGEWRVLPFLAMALPFAAWRGRARLVAGARLLPLALGSMLAGYYVVYLLSPQNLAWHLDTSLVRLLLQLWPLALVLWGLTFPCRELDSAVPSTAQLPTRLAFVGVNTLAALALVVVLSGQLAANEFAVKRDRAGTIRVTLGDGWHGREHHGRDTWAWSGGRATLDVQTPASSSSAPLTLRFSLRSLGPRTITIRHGERVVWQRTGPDALVPVEITGLILDPGRSTLEIATDTPGLPESPAPGARALAFALYNLTLP